MNKDRRKRIAALLETLTGLQDEVENLQNEEREAFDNMPESLQQGDRGQATEQAADNLDTAKSNLEDLIPALEEAAQ